MTILLKIIVHALVIMGLAAILPGIYVSGFGVALVVAIVLGVINAVLKPVLVALTLPINILTLGLFSLVINALLILLASTIVPGFDVTGLGWAIVYGLLLSLVTSMLS